VRDRGETRWWRAEERHRLTVLRAALDDVYRSSDRRMASYERAVRLYQEKQEVVIGRNLATPARLDFNLTATLALTARAHYAEFPPPRAAITTTGGLSEVRQRGRALQKWSSGAVATTKLDKIVRETVAVRSALFGDGVVRVGSRWGQLTATAVRPWDLWAHEEDERTGDLRSLYSITEEDRGVLAHLYPDQAKAIDDTDGYGLVPWSSLGRLYSGRSHRIPVLEAWHLPSAPDADDGRHVVAIQDLVLVDEPWQQSRFPFTFWGWRAPVGGGFWSTGIADGVGEFQRQIGLLLHRLQQAIDLTTNPRMLAPIASKPRPWPPTNEAGGILWYHGNVPPAWDVARAVSPEIAAQIERLYSQGFRQEGISEMASMGVKPAGLNSGEALRVYADKSSGRLASWTLGAQEMYVEVTDLMLDEARRLTEKDPDFSIVYEDQEQGIVERIPFLDVDLERDAYVVQKGAVSSLPESPAGRRALVADMLATGQIDPARAARLTRDPDLEADADLDEARVTWLKRTLENMLFGDGAYVPPEPMDDLVNGKALIAQYYAKARAEGVAPERLALARKWAAACVALMTPPPAPPPAPGAAPAPLPETEMP
jgi:hypothetical protein